MIKEKDKKQFDASLYSCDWIADRQRRNVEIDREMLMLEIRWLQQRENKKKEKNGNNK